jgi:hypothetical protein
MTLPHFPPGSTRQVHLFQVSLVAFDQKLADLVTENPGEIEPNIPLLRTNCASLSRFPLFGSGRVVT